MKECENTFWELKTLLGRAPLLSKPKNGETLLIYLAVLDKAVRSLLICEEGQTQLSVYYVSKALQDANTRPSVKRQALANFVAEFAHIPEGLFEAQSQKIPTWKLYVDGSLGEARVGARILLVSPDGHNLNCALYLELKAPNMRRSSKA
ncbi:Ribonuclease H [Abeliophyllum distichum]|uniref:Ribonuclease H n=1 Tax=Abeliophyllum distichum TaxID=126358 RepID=A0ABD1REE5_9LAMI